jgi:hypothetical protein
MSDRVALSFNPFAGTVRAFGRHAGLLCPLLTSAPRSGGLSAPSVPWDTVQISWGKPHSLPRTPAGFTVLALDGYGLCDFLPARPTSAASYPVSVRRVAILLHASFRRSLAVPPLRFARASPPSGCTGDFHPQAVGHAQHTGRAAPAGAGAAARPPGQRWRAALGPGAVGAKGCLLPVELREGSDLRRCRRAVVRVEQHLPLQQDAGDPE